MGRKRGPQAMAVGRRFGENLVELRGRAGLSQIGTAERAGLNRTEIKLREAGAAGFVVNCHAHGYRLRDAGGQR